jgi:nuclease HARBI1
MKRLRESDDEDEVEVVAAFLLYVEMVRRQHMAYGQLRTSVESVVSYYVHLRGGVNEVFNFEVPSVKFQPQLICEKWFSQHFRFTHHEMDRVVLAFVNAGFPSVVRTKTRDKCGLYEALCMMCFKYAFPMRLGTMVKVFGSSVCRMSRIVSSLRRLIFHRFRASLATPQQLAPNQLDVFCAAVKKKSSLGTCFGFIDGTVREICKPSALQGPLYNGKDRKHALKYQGVTTPDGMFLQLAGPWPGSRHDQFMVRESGILDYLESIPRRASDGAVYCIYADQGYSQAFGIETPYFDGAVNALHEAFNQCMASSRISVEWAFGAIVTQWQSTAFTPQQQLLSNRKIGQVYLVAGLLCNLLNTMHPNNTSKYFGVAPPVLEVYMRNACSPACL